MQGSLPLFCDLYAKQKPLPKNSEANSANHNLNAQFDMNTVCLF